MTYAKMENNLTRITGMSSLLHCFKNMKLPKEKNIYSTYKKYTNLHDRQNLLRSATTSKKPIN